jgi:GGDEF domain-containing protein
LVVPETTAKGAEQTAARIRERVAKDGEIPPLVSVGTAVFPEDGKTIETLLSRADHSLYDMNRSLRDPKNSPKLESAI